MSEALNRGRALEQLALMKGVIFNWPRRLVATLDPIGGGHGLSVVSIAVYGAIMPSFVSARVADVPMGVPAHVIQIARYTLAWGRGSSQREIYFYPYSTDEIRIFTDLIKLWAHEARQRHG